MMTSADTYGVYKDYSNQTSHPPGEVVDETTPPNIAVMIRGALEVLESELSALYDKLSPVLITDDLPDRLSSIQMPKSKCELGHTLAGLYETVGSITNNVIEQRGRVNL